MTAENVPINAGLPIELTLPAAEVKCSAKATDIGAIRCVAGGPASHLACESN
jgi:hypothetical protein